MNIILEVTNLKKYYGMDENQVKALDGVDLQIIDGEFVAIVGSSGSGKSTLLNLIGGLDMPTEGSVIINGKEIYKMDEDELTVFRRKQVGFVFQDFNLIPVLSVYENIVLPVQLDNNVPDKEYINQVVKLLGIEGKLDVFPAKLSGGQQQRAAIARALAAKPAIILADEPTGNLDSKTTMQVMEILKESAKQFKQTIIMITHNEEIAKLCDRRICIEDGKILEDSMSHGRII